METLVPAHRVFSSAKKAVSIGTAAVLLFSAGCSGVAPSKAASGAGTGAVVGGVAGAVVGNNSSMGSGTGILSGVAAGAIVGGIVGMVQDAKERKEQDRLAQERAYSQDVARRRKEEAARRAANEEELLVSQGFRISELELAEAQKKLDDASARLKKLQDEKAAALAKKKSLDEALQRTLSTEAAIAALEEELARLKGENPVQPLSSDSTALPNATVK
jgi:outer membrane lipoprotein SlyB